MLLNACLAQCCWAEWYKSFFFPKQRLGVVAMIPLHRDRWSGIHIEMRFADMFTSNRKVRSHGDYKHERAGMYASPHLDAAEAHLLVSSVHQHCLEG